MSYDEAFDRAELGELRKAYEERAASAPNLTALNDDDWQAFERISAYLAGGPESIKPQVQEIESECEAALKQAGFDLPDAKAYFDAWSPRHQEKMRAAEAGKPAPAKVQAFSKLLTTVLEKTERTIGLDPAMYPYFLGTLTAEGFARATEGGRQFKDLLNPIHGEFTHRIQWNLCVRKNCLGKRPAGKLFEAITRYGDLWDHLFDRYTQDEKHLGPVIHGNEDFRRPELLNPWLCRAHERFPLIASFLSARQRKRSDLMRAESKNAYLKDYASLKKHKRLYAHLSDPERKEIDAIVQRGCLTPS